MDGFGAHWEWACSVSRLDHGFPFFIFPLLSLFMVGSRTFCPPRLFPFSLIFSQSFKKGITPNFYFRFLSHSSSPVLYIFYGMTGKESSWGDYPFFSFTFNFFFPPFFQFFFISPLAEIIKITLDTSLFSFVVNKTFFPGGVFFFFFFPIRYPFLPFCARLLLYFHEFGNCFFYYFTPSH